MIVIVILIAINYESLVLWAGNILSRRQSHLVAVACKRAGGISAKELWAAQANFSPPPLFLLFPNPNENETKDMNDNERPGSKGGTAEAGRKKSKVSDTVSIGSCARPTAS